MLYTEDFTMRHYVGFSQIGSHILITSNDDLKVGKNNITQQYYTRHLKLTFVFT